MISGHKKYDQPVGKVVALGVIGEHDSTHGAVLLGEGVTNQGRQIVRLQFAQAFGRRQRLELAPLRRGQHGHGRVAQESANFPQHPQLLALLRLGAGQDVVDGDDVIDARVVLGVSLADGGRNQGDLWQRTA